MDFVEQFVEQFVDQWARMTFPGVHYTTGTEPYWGIAAIADVATLIPFQAHSSSITRDILED